MSPEELRKQLVSDPTFNPITGTTNTERTAFDTLTTSNLAPSPTLNVTQPNEPSALPTLPINEPPQNNEIQDDFFANIESLTNKFLNKDRALQNETLSQTAPFESELADIQSQRQALQAQILANDEALRSAGETLPYQNRERAFAQRQSQIEDIRLSAREDALLGKIGSAQRKAKLAVDAEFEQIEGELQAARSNILQNYDSFTPTQKRRADAALLRLDSQDQFVAEQKTRRQQVEQIALSVAGRAPNSVIQQIQGMTDPVQAQALAAPYLPGEKRSTQVVDIGGEKFLIDTQTGETIRNLGGGASGNVLQLSQQQSDIQQITSAINDSALSGAVGPNAFTRFAPLQGLSGAKRNFIGSIEQLRSQLNLESLIQAKSRGATFGALSDQELQVLASAATRLGSWVVTDKNGNVTGYSIDEKNFKRELDRINNFAKLDYILKGGNPADVEVVELEDGTLWSQNSDGTLTQIR